ncbi:hypothetical protein ABPS01_09985 [Streptococcus sp. ZJ151]|uniref:hypothetical protein n=1 Tax=Streptococcus jiangjianxini TaxID=3161189 RepID=UPI0032ED25B2
MEEGWQGKKPRKRAYKLTERGKEIINESTHLVLDTLYTRDFGLPPLRAIIAKEIIRLGDTDDLTNYTKRISEDTYITRETITTALRQLDSIGLIDYRPMTNLNGDKGEIKINGKNTGKALIELLQRNFSEDDTDSVGENEL